MEGVAEMEEDLHIFGLAGAIDGAGQPSHTIKPAVQQGGGKSGVAESTKRQQEVLFVPIQRQSAYPPNWCDEIATTGCGGSGWGTATGGGVPRGIGREERRRSAAVPRAFAMNVDRVSGLYREHVNGAPVCTAVLKEGVRIRVLMECRLFVDGRSLLYRLDSSLFVWLLGGDMGNENTVPLHSKAGTII